MRRILHRLHRWSVHFRYGLFCEKPEHVWIASYPRSGNTWLRRMLYDVLFGDREDAPPLREAIPDIHQGVSRIRQMPGRFIKTHYPWCDAYQKVVYLLRDPAGCVPSYHEYVKERSPRRAGTLASFMERELDRGGVWGSWGDHVRSYMDSGLDPMHLLVVRYEQMLLDPAAWLLHILQFSGEEADPAVVRRVAEAHMDRMLGNPVGDYAAKAKALHQLQTRKGPAALALSRGRRRESPAGRPA